MEGTPPVGHHTEGQRAHAQVVPPPTRPRPHRLRQQQQQCHALQCSQPLQGPVHLQGESAAAPSPATLPAPSSVPGVQKHEVGSLLCVF